MSLAVFADGPRQQAWVVDALEAAAAGPNLRIAVLVIPDPAPAAPAPSTPAALHWYGALDGRAAPVHPDPFACRDLAAALPAVPVLRLDAWTEPALERLRGYRLDLGLDLGLPGLDRHGPTVAPLGLLRPRRGHRLGGVEVAAEVLTGEPAVSSHLDLVTASGARAIASSWSRTDRLSLGRTAGRQAWKSSHLLRRTLGAFATGPTALSDGGAAGLPTAPPEAEAPRRRRISSARVGAFLPRLAGRLLAAAWRTHCTRHGWFLACRLDPPDPVPEDLAGFAAIRPPRDRFWADPFPVVSGDICHLFVEEWPYRLGRGRIAVLEMDRAGRWQRLGTALEGDGHLSYPFTFRWRGEVFMVPESAADGAVALYRAAAYPLGWEREAVLLEGADAVDATLLEADGGWWMFVNCGGAGVSRHDELYLYRAESPLGPWRPHPRNPVVSDVRSARPAGRLIRRGGHLLRPAQDCSRHYGHAVEVRRVVELSMTSYREEPWCRLDPAGLAGANRLHTLNTDTWVAVVDGHRRRLRPFCRGAS